ncbi:hypothetical protein U6A24_11495 [Aquimarina gracilis]|uniref:Uncharacterized protein n=1 Tax=Aquimarina gracilis TaxID=874422 RepID=A0ABU5ZW38_9FLAO|nr:hypothetical protein [Aquimarina gracilis]MEB3346089.1 hypothetical protein [Aquimarina gracilis]
MEPSFTEIIYYIFFGLLTSLGQVFILAICLYYTFKIGTKPDSILLLLGSVIWLLCSITTRVGVLYAKVWGSELYLTFTYVLQGFLFLGSLLFVIGFFLLIRRTLSGLKNEN